MSVTAQTRAVQLKNFVAGEWRASTAADFLRVVDPATQEILAEVPLSNEPDITGAIDAAAAAFPAWRRTPPEERIQYLFKLKQLLEEHLDEIARICPRENGKTLNES